MGVLPYKSRQKHIQLNCKVFTKFYFADKETQNRYKR